MTKEEYVQKAILEAKSTSGSTYAILALMDEVKGLIAEINKIEGAVLLLRDTIGNSNIGNYDTRRVK